MGLGDLLDTAAAVSVVRLGCDRQAVLEQNLTVVRVSDLDQELVQPDAAVKLYPSTLYCTVPVRHCLTTGTAICVM